MNPLAWLNPTRWILLAALAAALFIGVPILWHRHIEAQQDIGYQRRAREDKDAAEAQTGRMRDLQRQAEMRYVVRAQARERVIVQTVREIHEAAAPLAACPVPDAVRVRLNAVGACARGDPAAACGDGESVSGPGTAR